MAELQLPQTPLSPPHTSTMSMVSDRATPPGDDGPTPILDAFKWDDLKTQKNPTVVDLGDAAGPQSILLASRFDYLRFYIQDYDDSVLEIARRNWWAEGWGCMNNGMVRFKKVTLGGTQPADLENPAIFLLHYSLDGRSDSDIKQCLSSLWAARAEPPLKTYLLIMFNRPPGMQALDYQLLKDIAEKIGWKPDDSCGGVGAGYIRFVSA